MKAAWNLLMTFVSCLLLVGAIAGYANKPHPVMLWFIALLMIPTVVAFVVMIREAPGFKRPRSRREDRSNG